MGSERVSAEVTGEKANTSFLRCAGRESEGRAHHILEERSGESGRCYEPDNGEKELLCFSTASASF